MADLHKTNGGYIGVPYTETFDPHWSNVPLCVEPAADATSYLADETGKSLTYAGDAYVSGGGIIFDGSGDKVSAALADSFGTGDFTIEVIAAASTVSGTYRDLLSLYTVTPSKRIVLSLNSGSLHIYRGSWVDAGYVWPLSQDVCVRVTRTGSAFTIEVNGVTEYFDTDTNDYNENLTAEIGLRNGGTLSWDGTIYACRITKGVARTTDAPSKIIRPFPTRRYPSGVWSIDAAQSVRLP